MENVACIYLKKQGLRLLLRNYRCKMGEIDLIMQDKDQLVFVEVRYRKTTSYGSSAESIDYKKQIKLLRTAEFYLLTTKMHFRLVRFDIIAIQHQENHYTIQWIKNAIEQTYL